jgi:hypothetical protein
MTHAFFLAFYEFLITYSYRTSWSKKSQGEQKLPLSLFLCFLESTALLTIPQKILPIVPILLCSHQNSFERQVFQHPV